MDKFDAAYANRLQIFESLKRFVNYKVPQHMVRDDSMKAEAKVNSRWS
jgi:hypothetical protein